MKTIFRNTGVALLFSLLAGVTYAQSGYSSISYQASVPFGGTASYLDKTSWRGGGGEIGTFLNSQLSIGLSANWNVFYQKVGLTTVNVSDATTLSGVEYRYINAFPLFAQVRYFTRDGDGILPYVGLGVGTAYMKQETRIGGYGFTNDGWQFGLYPEAGISFQMGNKRMLLGARYNYGFKTSQLPDLSYLTIRLGFIFSQWQ
jgi:opacity protein-like surface antigen